MIHTLNPEMQRVLDEAERYNDWFSASTHENAPIRCHSSTLKALWKRQLLDSLLTDVMNHGCKRSMRIYKAKKRLPSQEQ